jgi:hypothetical protein
VVPDIYNVNTVPHILASNFNCAYLRWYWGCVNNSVSLILLTWCQIQRTTSSLRNVDCCPSHTHFNYRSTYWGYNIQQNVAPLLLEICRQFNRRYAANMVPNTAHILQFRYLNCGPGRIQCIYNSAYSGLNILQTYLRRYWRYIDNSLCVILQPWCQIQRTSSGLRYLGCGPGPYTM